MLPETLRLPTRLDLPGEGPLHLAASLWQPPGARRLWVCQPGGNMNRHYFDLRPPEGGDDSYSFAAQMSARGDAVLALDHLGIGDSDRPADGWQLTPERLAAATGAAIAAVGDRLPRLPMIGLGHSMGAMMTVLVQQRAQPFAAIALLGFSTRGLPAFLPPALHHLNGAIPDGEALRPHAEQMFRQPFPLIHRSGGGNRELFGSAQAEPAGIAALKRATDCLLPIPALRSMLPGNVAAEAARIAVPVFLGIGAQDLVGAPDAVPAAFPRSPAVRLEVLPDTGHSHFLFASRAALFDALADWAQSLPAAA
jgi:pimeloyl-ACP methyl ester carboxylesterase